MHQSCQTDSLLFPLSLISSFSHSHGQFSDFLNVTFFKSGKFLTFTVKGDVPDVPAKMFNFFFFYLFILGAHAWEFVCVFGDFGSICFEQTIIQCDSQGFSFPEGFSRLLFPLVTQRMQQFSLTAGFDKEVLSSSHLLSPLQFLWTLSVWKNRLD